MNDELYINNNSNLTDIIINIWSALADIITNHRDVIVFIMGFIIILAMLVLMRQYLPKHMTYDSERETSHNVSHKNRNTANICLRKDHNAANICLRKDYRYDKKK